MWQHVLQVSATAETVSVNKKNKQSTFNFYKTKKQDI